jgi:hypothetical protein
MQITVDQFWDQRGIIPRHLITSGIISERVSLNIFNHPNSVRIIQRNWRRYCICKEINKRVKENLISKKQALELLQINEN